MNTREIAERYVTLVDGYMPDCRPAGEIISAVHGIEEMLERGDILDDCYELLDEIVENAPDYADEAKAVKYVMEVADTTLLPF